MFVFRVSTSGVGNRHSQGNAMVLPNNRWLGVVPVAAFLRWRRPKTEAPVNRCPKFAGFLCEGVILTPFSSLDYVFPSDWHEDGR